MVLLVGNYLPDQQQSMQRFAQMMFDGLTAAGIPAEIITPSPWLGRFCNPAGSVGKWLAYVDKFLFFPRALKRRLTRGVSVVHICDHSNAVYARHCKPLPLVVTCHDLLAVRGGLGEDTDCPASATGKVLQRWILRGLQMADAIACVSRATLADATRLLGGLAKPKLSVVTSGLNYPYRNLPPDEAVSRLEKVPRLSAGEPFILHVGSNLKRKNRDGVLRIFARSAARWDGLLVIAGDPLTPSLHSLGDELGIAERIVEVVAPDNLLLEALYNRATALLFPSRFEGFGWPIAEAQACGCPVICSDREPLPEVAGDAALIRPIDDEDGFAEDILSLTNSAKLKEWSERALRNAERFSTARMIDEYIAIYRSLSAQL